MCACLLLRSGEEVCQGFEDQCGRNPIRPKKREENSEAVVFNFHLCQHTDTNKQTSREGCINMCVGHNKRIRTGRGVTVPRLHPSDTDTSSPRSTSSSFQCAGGN